MNIPNDWDGYITINTNGYQVDQLQDAIYLAKSTDNDTIAEALTELLEEIQSSFEDDN